jgi:hypothetical protein
MCVLIFCTIFIWNISYCKKNWRDVIKKCIGFYVKYPLFLSHFREILNPSTDVRKMPKYEISGKSVQWEPSCSIRAGGRADGPADRHEEANSPFLKFYKRA